MNKPNVAVIITNHNYGDYVCSAILSAVNQNYEKNHLKVYLVDDCSTDDSITKVIELVNNHNGKDFVRGIRALKNKPLHVEAIINGVQFFGESTRENVKQGAARNIGIQKLWDWADYFAILDSDDEMMSDKITKCIEKFTEFPNEVGEVVADYLIETPEKGTTTYEYKPSYNRELLLKDCHLHSGAVISKKALEKVGLYDTECVPKEDYLMHLKVSEHFVCVHIAEPLTLVRVTPKNTTVTSSEDFHKQQFALMVEKYEQYKREMVI